MVFLKLKIGSRKGRLANTADELWLPLLSVPVSSNVRADRPALLPAGGVHRSVPLAYPATSAEWASDSGSDIARRYGWTVTTAEQSDPTTDSARLVPRGSSDSRPPSR